MSHQTNSAMNMAAPIMPQPSLAKMGYEEFNFKPFSFTGSGSTAHATC